MILRSNIKGIIIKLGGRLNFKSTTQGLGARLTR